MYSFINNWSRPIELAELADTAALDLPDGTYRLTVSDAVGTSASRWEVLDAVVAGGAGALQRGLEGTLRQDWPAGSVIYASVTAGLLSTVFAGIVPPLLTKDNFVERIEGGALGLDGFMRFFGNPDIGCYINAKSLNQTPNGYGIPWLGTTVYDGYANVGPVVIYSVSAVPGGGAGIVKAGVSDHRFNVTTGAGSARYVWCDGPFLEGPVACEDGAYIEMTVDVVAVSSSMRIELELALPFCSDVRLICGTDAPIPTQWYITYSDPEGASVLVPTGITVTAGSSITFRLALAGDVLNVSRGPSSSPIIIASLPLAALPPPAGFMYFKLSAQTDVATAVVVRPSNIHGLARRA